MKSWSNFRRLCPLKRSGNSIASSAADTRQEASTTRKSSPAESSGARRALGPSGAGVMGTDSDLVRRVIRSGRNAGEAFWELPLVDEYAERLDVGARYETKAAEHPLTLLLAVENATNRSYWQSALGNAITIADPLTVKATARMSF